VECYELRLKTEVARIPSVSPGAIFALRCHLDRFGRTLTPTKWGIRHTGSIFPLLRASSLGGTLPKRNLAKEKQ
jgi:hypothetical protein